MRITVSECAGASYSNSLSAVNSDVTGATRDGASKLFSPTPSATLVTSSAR